MRTLKITQMNGKVTTMQVNSISTAEMVVRSEMCWYSTGTVFTIDGKVFRKIHVRDSIRGYADLEEVL